MAKVLISSAPPRIELAVFGPMPIPFDQSANSTAKRIRKTHVTEFWKDGSAQHVMKKHGCYVFAVRAAKGFKPWYVGKAERALREECFGNHQMNHYNDVLFDNVKGSPVMFFVGPRGTKNKIPRKVVGELERFLIQHAVYRNPDLKNVKDTKNLPKWSIAGAVRSGQGKPTVGTKGFKTMMKLPKR